MHRLLCLVLLVAPAPAAAHTWTTGDMTDAGGRPRIVLAGDTGDEVRSRLEREPYASLLPRLVSLAGQEHDPDDHERYAEAAKAQTARAAAYLFCLDRTTDGSGAIVPFASDDERDAMGAVAATYLLSMYTESRAKGYIDFVEDIFTAQELHLWSETLDLLLGADRDALGDDRAQAIQNVADLAADFYADHALVNWLACRTLVNNHRSKSAAALGLAAIALNGEDFDTLEPDGRYDPWLWAAFAVRNIDLVLRDILTDADGGYMEGGSYLDYSAIDHVPFLWAWHRYTGGAALVVDFAESVGPFYVVGAAEPYEIPDLWADEMIEQQLLWAVRTMLPDRTQAPFDDCTPGARLTWGFYAHPDWQYAGLYRWAWEELGTPGGGSVDTAPLLLEAFDDTVPALTPEQAGVERHQVLPRAGQVVFRSSWQTDAVYTLLQCEHGPASAWAQTRWGQYIDGAAGHEHPDPLAVMLHAAGEPLIIDSGYLGWEDHDRVWDPTHHNLVLIDGEGPAMPFLSVPPMEVGPDGEVVLTDYTVEGGYVPAADGQAWMIAADVGAEGVAVAEATTRYDILVPATDWWRRSVFLADRYVVLFDRLAPLVADGTSHTYTHTLHTNCGGDSGGEHTDTAHGATCAREGASLQIAVLSPGDEAHATREDVHDAGHWVERTHTVVETTVESDGGVEYLTMLLPEPVVEGVPDAVDLEIVECAGACAAWAWEGLSCEAWTGASRALAAPDGSVVLDATSGAWCGDAAGLSGWFGGLSDGVALTLEMTFDEAGAAASWRAAVLAQDGDSAELVLPRVSDVEPDGACDWELDDDVWTLSTSAPAVIETAATARDVVASLWLDGFAHDEPLAVPVGEAVTLDATASCGASDYVWSIDVQPEMSTLAQPDSAADQLVLQPALPGLYVVSVTAEDGAQADVAEIAFEVVGETTLDGDDDDSADPADDDDTASEQPPDESGQDGCQCRSAPAARGTVALVAILGLAVAHRRRSGR
jgi:MYXO-CTERM domain-containing protein